MAGLLGRIGGAGQGATGEVAPPLRPVRFVEPTTWSYFFLGSDIAAIAIAFVGAFWVAGVFNQVVAGRWWVVSPEEVALRVYDFTFLTLMMLGWLYQRGHYVRRMLFWTATADLLKACLGGMLLDTFVQFLLKQTISRSWFVWIWILLPPLLIGLRIVTRRILDLAGVWQRRVVIAGDVEAARVAQDALLSDTSMGYEIAGRVPLEAVAEAPDGTSYAALLRRFDAGLLLCAPGDEPFHMPRRRLAELVRERVDFAVMPSLETLPAAGFHAQYFYNHDVVLLSYRNTSDLPVARAAKVALDMLAAGLLVVLLAPAMALIALAIKRDGGPVFFAQKRIGLGGRTFGCLKFRTMVMNGDEVLRQHLASDPRRRRMGQRPEAPPRPARHRHRPPAAADQPGRAAATLQHPARRHEPGRPAADRGEGDSPLPRRFRLVLRRAPRPDRAVAGLRPQRHLLRPQGPSRFLVRPQLDAVGRHRDPGEDRPGGAAAPRGDVNPCR